MVLREQLLSPQLYLLAANTARDTDLGLGHNHISRVVCGDREADVDTPGIEPLPEPGVCVYIS